MIAAQPEDYDALIELYRNTPDDDNMRYLNSYNYVQISLENTSLIGLYFKATVELFFF